MPAKLEFPTRGRRIKPEYGLSYVSRCGHYRVYKSDQVAGVAIKPIRWVAIVRYQYEQHGRQVHGEHVISWHKKRETAIRACERHCRQTNR